MSYTRVYPVKNNTIFKKNTGTSSETNGLINTGANSIFELMDGNGESIIVMKYDIDSIKDLLTNYNYTCKLKLWDAGTVFEPAMLPKTIDLIFFEEDFVEGNGFFFRGEDAASQPSNYTLRDETNDWDGIVQGTGLQGLFPALQLDKANEDITIDVTSFIQTAVTNNSDPGFGIQISNHEDDNITYTKFLYSRHTRTIFQPFLEFTIEDTIIDQRTNIEANKSKTLYLLTESGDNFVGSSVTAEIQKTDGTVLSTPTIDNPQPGIYSFNFVANPAGVGESRFDVWKVDGKVVAKNIFTIKSPNVVKRENDKNNGLFFAPVSSYSHATIRKNDKVRINVTSQIRGKGTVVTENYEYRIVTTSGFEIVPWSPVNLYDGRMYFIIDTSFFFEELNYEIFVRFNDGKTIKTSDTTLKFRLRNDGPTHLDSKNASPYNNRHDIFDK